MIHGEGDAIASKASLDAPPWTARGDAGARFSVMTLIGETRVQFSGEIGAYNLEKFEVDPGNWTGSEERVFPWSGRLAEGKT